MNISNRKKGFSLLELIVSVGVFTVIMVIAISSLLSLVETNRKAQTFKSVLNNINFAVDSMARSLRTGTGHKCTSPASEVCISGGGSSGVEFTDSDGVVTRYRYNATDKSIERDDGAGFLRLTAPEVSVNNLRFYVGGTCAAEAPCPPKDEEQPRVTIVTQGTVSRGEDVVTNFNLQTTITQRVFDK